MTWAEAWNGRSWSIRPTPNPTGATESELLSVSCTSATACAAVGFNRTRAGIPSTLAEAWNGKSWAMQRTPNPTGASASGLLAVSCTSAKACVAVGDYISHSGVQSALTDAWNGTSWRIQTPSRPAGSIGSKLLAVSCTSANACVAVGGYGDRAGKGLTLAEAWNGSNWRLETTPNPKSSIGGGLLGISCASAGACEAVGNYFGGANTDLALVEHWNGKSWRVQTTPKVAGSALFGVSCTSASACTAVGTETAGSSGVTLVEAWNGTSWTTEATPNPTGSTGTGLLAVACTSASACAAVGFYAHGTDSINLPLVEASNGESWSIRAIAIPAGAAISDLLGVSCTSASACVAVGTYENRVGTTLTLAEARNGERWRIEATPNPARSMSTELRAVSCSSRKACVAVGWWYEKSTGDVTLAEAWNGKGWRIESTPKVTDSADANLFSVSCTSPSACVAVGDHTSLAGAELALAEVWNGKRWRIETPPKPVGATQSRLLGVWCTSVSACTAVGTDSVGGSGSATLAEHWNGRSWRIETTPKQAGSASGVLSAVSCTSANACTAVGTTYGAGADGSATLAEAWNGKRWRVETTPNPTAGAIGNVFAGVSCTSASACEAVGSYTNGAGLPVPFAEAWNGKSWKIETVPDPAGTSFSLLNGVSRASADFAAVGFHQGSSGIQMTLAVARFSP